MSGIPGPYNINSTFLRLRSDVTVEPIPVDGGFWKKLSQRGHGSFHNEYLVTCHRFDRDWSSWEMHPNGVWHKARIREPSRVVFITAGEGTRHRDAGQ